MKHRLSPVPLTTFILGLSVGAAASALAGTIPYERLEVFADALAIIEARYVDERDSSELIYDAIGGLTQGLDDHSVFLDPDAYRDLLEVTSGEYSGVGIDVAAQEGRIVIREVLAGSPAHSAGLLAGDLIVSVDDVTLDQEGAEVLVERIRGEVGTVVVLGVLREEGSTPLEFAVRRDRVKTQSVFSKRVADQFLLLRIDRFQRDTFEEVQQALAGSSSSAEGPPAGIVLDLRGNPGGYLSEAVEISNLWIDSGPIVSTVGRSASAEQDLATSVGTDRTTPLAVLVDSGSASAAEILAGALADHGRARLIGYPTYGKGSVQQFFNLPDGSALKLTTAHYYTPSGQHIHGSGIVPDFLLGGRGEPGPEFSVEDLLEVGAPASADATEDPTLGLALAWLANPGTTDAWFAAQENDKDQ